jgi:predicted ribosomally synthesized peptide with nif11-like leader
MTTATINPVQAFLEKVKTDTQLRKQLEMLNSNQQNTEKTPAINEIVKIAEKAGFKFTTKEYEQVARKMYVRNSKSTQPIGEKELISVACGCCKA